MRAIIHFLNFSSFEIIESYLLPIFCRPFILLAMIWSFRELFIWFETLGTCSLNSPCFLMRSIPLCVI